LDAAVLDEFGTGRDGRVFSGIRGGELASVTYRRTWDSTRRAALTPAEYASPLARRVYDLRHACVSTWLNGGVPPTQVVEWAGHSVAVLLRVYAKCGTTSHPSIYRKVSMVVPRCFVIKGYHRETWHRCT
jgi:integrase